MFENAFYAAGFIVGFLLVVIISMIFHVLRKKKRQNQNLPTAEYDERQLAARGRAFQIGFFVTVLYMIVVGILDPSKLSLPLDLLMYLGACLGICIFGIVCIIKDAYLPVRNRPVAMILILLLAAGLNLFCGFRDCENEVYRLNLVIGIMVMVVLLVFIGKLIYDYVQESEE